MAEIVGGGISGLTPEDVRRVCGDLADWKVKAILEAHGTIGDLGVARRENDVMGEERRALTGASARIYDILAADEEFAGDERTG